LLNKNLAFKLSLIKKLSLQPTTNKTILAQNSVKYIQHRTLMCHCCKECGMLSLIHLKYRLSQTRPAFQ